MESPNIILTDQPDGFRIYSGLVLIVEDERDLVATLEYNLHQEGFQRRETRVTWLGLKGLDTRQNPSRIRLMSQVE